MIQRNEKDKVETQITTKTEDSSLTSMNFSPDTTAYRNLNSKNSEGKSFLARWKTSRFWVIRAIYIFLVSVWTIVMIIGGFILWLISFLFI